MCLCVWCVSFMCPCVLSSKSSIHVTHTDTHIHNLPQDKYMHMYIHEQKQILWNAECDKNTFVKNACEINLIKATL